MKHVPMLSEYKLTKGGQMKSVRGILLGRLPFYIGNMVPKAYTLLCINQLNKSEISLNYFRPCLVKLHTVKFEISACLNLAN